jgi:hypothetical protein
MTTLNSTQRDALKPFKVEAYSYYTEADAIKENLKDLVEAAAEKTGIDKKIVAKHFAVSYKGTLDDLNEEVSNLNFLAED